MTMKLITLTLRRVRHACGAPAALSQHSQSTKPRPMCAACVCGMHLQINSGAKHRQPVSPRSHPLIGGGTGKATAIRGQYIAPARAQIGKQHPWDAWPRHVHGGAAGPGPCMRPPPAPPPRF